MINLAMQILIFVRKKNDLVVTQSEKKDPTAPLLPIVPEMKDETTMNAAVQLDAAIQAFENSKKENKKHKRPVC